MKLLALLLYVSVYVVITGPQIYECCTLQQTAGYLVGIMQNTYSTLKSKGASFKPGPCLVS